MLTAQRLHVTRGGTPILRDLSIAVEPGTLTALLGRNGAGKSTLMKALAGELAESRHTRALQWHGAITIDGQPLDTLGAQPLARRRAVLPQSSHPAFAFSAEEIVLFGRYPHAGSGGALASTDHEIARRALELADAATLAARDVTTLSGGEHARVQFARVLAQIWPDGECAAPAACAQSQAPARYLLLDEPTAALDLAHQHRLLGTVRRLTRDWRIGALAIVHDPNLAARYADRIALLIDGTIAAQGAAHDMIRADLIEDCYGLPVRVLDTGGGSAPVVVPA